MPERMFLSLDAFIKKPASFLRKVEKSKTRLFGQAKKKDFFDSALLEYSQSDSKAPANADEKDNAKRKGADSHDWETTDCRPSGQKNENSAE
jgi:hypothetical protein